jgi:hypothetical protein
MYKNTRCTCNAIREVLNGELAIIGLKIGRYNMLEAKLKTSPVSLHLTQAIS